LFTVPFDFELDLSFFSLPDLAVIFACLIWRAFFSQNQTG